MKAGSVSQSKARQKAESQNSVSEGKKRNLAQASEAGNKEAGLTGSAAPPTPVTSVSWRSQRWLGWRAIAALLGGLILRLWMWSAFPQTGGDSLVYSNLAKNILRRWQFALTDGSGVPHSTLIRLPGYPLFLAACFRVFGSDNYRAVIGLQIAFELAACLLLADFVRRIASPRAGLNTLWLATMCPFIAVYACAPLTESLTFDMICAALWSLQRTLSGRDSTKVRTSANSGQFSWAPLLLFTLTISYAALLRPDGALLAIALWPALLFSRGAGVKLAPALRQAALCALISILPFVAWTARNWHTFHVFEPLATRYATDPGEDPHLGWQHWVSTWCLDFSCTSEIYWNVPDGSISADDLPAQAFDSPAQQEQTLQLIADYNRQDNQISDQLDARFEALARQRAAAHPIRTFLLMPLGRLADMTLRPRVENLTIDLRWWEYWNHHAETRFSVAYALVNLLFLLLGLAGFIYRPRFWPYMAAYLILRSLLLLTIEAPETRYTLEFFPILFVLGGITLKNIFTRKAGSTTNTGRPA
jgi:Dolichyl-phosphate-mannose-protein mannosyltransferase